DLGGDHSLPIVHGPNVVIEYLMKVAEPVVFERHTKEIGRRRVYRIARNQLVQQSLLCVTRNGGAVEDVEEVGDCLENLAVSPEIPGNRGLLLFLHHDVDERAGIASEHSG